MGCLRSLWGERRMAFVASLYKFVILSVCGVFPEILILNFDRTHTVTAKEIDLFADGGSKWKHVDIERGVKNWELVITEQVGACLSIASLRHKYDLIRKFWVLDQKEKTKFISSN